jgi:hypothetical protein
MVTNVVISHSRLAIYRRIPMELFLGEELISMVMFGLIKIRVKFIIVQKRCPKDIAWLKDDYIENQQAIKKSRRGYCITYYIL